MLRSNLILRSRVQTNIRLGIGAGGLRRFARNDSLNRSNPSQGAGFKNIGPGIRRWDCFASLAMTAW